jgi:thiol-disulfide isomerase/thioredoxin
MEQNIFQVVNENNLTEILTNNIQKLVVIMLSSKDCNPCRQIKPKFVELSKQNKDTFFVYIDRTNYLFTNDKYFSEYQYTPTFLFYFGGNKIAFVQGAHEQPLVKTLAILKQKIEEKRQEMIQREKELEQQKILELNNLKLSQEQAKKQQVKIMSDDSSELLQKKITALNKLRDLVQQGAKLTKAYNLDSDYEDIILEIKFQTDPVFRQEILSMNKLPQQSIQSVVPVQPLQNEPKQFNDPNAILLKKQEQVKQIQELDMLNQKMQLQSLQKLRQLERIKTLKEQQEKNNKEVQ